MVPYFERIDDSVGHGFIFLETTKTRDRVAIFWFVEDGRALAVSTHYDADHDVIYPPAAVEDLARRTAEAEQSELVSFSITCNPEMDDATRSLIVEAGYPLLHRTKAEYQAYVAEFQADMAAYFEGKAAAEAAAFAADTTPVSGIAPAVLPEHVQPLLSRLRKDGYGELADGNIEEAIVRHAGGELVHSLPAQGRATEGNLVVPVREVCFIIDGVRRYLYFVVINDGDSWEQRWWVSCQRFTAGAAAEAMIAALDLYKHLAEEAEASIVRQARNPN